MTIKKRIEKLESESHINDPVHVMIGRDEATGAVQYFDADSGVFLDELPGKYVIVSKVEADLNAL